jgi:hypothetical protein
VIKVFHNEIAALPMSFDGLLILRECAFIFAFQVNKLLAALVVIMVDPNPFVSPCEHFILFRIIIEIPCCRCCRCFAMICSCSRGFCQWVVVPSLWSCCMHLFVSPFGHELKNVAIRIKHSSRFIGSQRVAFVREEVG